MAMIEIAKEELLESLKDGYTEYKNAVAAGSDEADLAHIKGFCTTIEQILSVYGSVTKDEIIEIKNPIIGDISLRRKKKVDFSSIDLETPSILRKRSK